MKKIAIAAFVAALMLGSAASYAQEFPEMPKPQKEHEWLNQLVGEWDGEFEMYMEPGKPPLKAKGSEKVRSLGGFWTIGEVDSSMMGMNFNAIMTLGYDPAKKKYVGTWVDSMSGYHWQYVGTVDESGKKLTLESRGPCPKRPGELSNFKEVLEIKDKDHKVFTSSIQDESGKWEVGMVGTYRRKK